MNLYKHISDTVNAKLGLTVALEIPKNRDFGDFATNAAMVLGKSRGQNPRAIAAEILPQIAALEFVADASIAGPGFINIKLKDEFILFAAGEQRNPKSETRNTIIDLDYGAYNVAKSLHIGHLRTSIVGDTFNRIAKFLGYKTISYNHIGDWGRPMGLVIAWILDNNIDAAKLTPSQLDTLYPLASERGKHDAEFMDKARMITKQLHDGNYEYTAIYNSFMPIALSEMDEVINTLNMMPFDNTLGERNAEKYVPVVEKILRDKNLIVPSDGAEIVNIKTESDTAPIPPFMFYNSRGSSTYDSTDLAALYYRKITDNPDKVIYMTDMRQQLHFQQVFRVAELAGLFTQNSIEHSYFGTINGKDGPLKTRDGNAAGLMDIIKMVRDAAAARVAESGKELTAETIDMIALSALKFNDLMHDVKSDYIFDSDTVTGFEGRTGPYILYTAVRLNSVLKKANQKSEIINQKTLATEERNLLLCVLDFERTINSAFEKRATDLLANYTYDLCQLINSFYHNCPILRDDVDENIRAHRLQIVQIARDTLATAIDLMGLKIPQEM